MDAIEAQLERGRFLECKPVWYSSNYVYLGRLDCGDAAMLVIYKPRSGETPLWDFPEGTLYRREAAAYRLSRLLDWPLVPPTVIREGPSGLGSVQLFIRHDPEKHFFVQREDQSLWPQLQRLCLFDAIANNADRKGGHCLLDASGHVWAIDNGLCFNEQYKLRSVIWDWAGEPIPEELLAELEAGLASLAGDSAEAAALRDLLSEREFEQTVQRAERLVRSGVFPLPGPARHYPWPLV
ncbi:MAG: SCO1664 family protein [Dehalococcoidia bacterium]|nr:SCO1664 family protein [Dehalococcoidia bacterium]